MREGKEQPSRHALGRRRTLPSRMLKIVAIIHPGNIILQNVTILDWLETTPACGFRFIQGEKDFRSLEAPFAAAVHAALRQSQT